MNKNDLFSEKDSRILQLADVMTNVMDECKTSLSKIYTISSGTLLNSEHNLVTEYMYTDTLIKINENIKSIINTINYLDIFISSKKEIKSFNINSTLQNILSFLTPLLKKHNISIKTDCFTANYIIGYENELSQIFLHILTSLINILKNETKSKFIVIKTKKNKNKTKIMINSSGGDIDDIPLDMSLYISKKIIEEYYKGEITITNSKFKETSVHGIEFCIHLSNIE
ncbi:MAG: hypothetical protein ACNI25_07825 [Halarcobacter sp.]